MGTTPAGPYRHCAILITAALALLLGPNVGRGGEACYLVVYGSQRIPNNPNYSHTFATFVRASCPGEVAGGATALEAHTISWLPANGVVRTLAFCPECGRNFGLHETIQLALREHERVSLWGPYQIEPELYHRALERIEELESGTVLYKANDAGRRSDHVSNCIHAVSAIARGRRLVVASPGWGEVASYAVLLRLEPWVIDCRRTHDWLVSPLGLDAYPIIYRSWQPPVSGAYLGPGFRLLGGERDVEATFGPPAARPVRR